jgi:hypothetical protein
MSRWVMVGAFLFVVAAQLCFCSSGGGGPCDGEICPGCGEGGICPATVACGGGPSTYRFCTSMDCVVGLQNCGENGFWDPSCSCPDD